MFTGIVEAVGEVVSIERESGNLRLGIRASFAPELQIDQSVAHNGICLTVVNTDPQQDRYTVEVIGETLEKTNLGVLREGDPVNLERSLRIGDRLDGHFVQGHGDCTGICKGISEADGSWILSIEHPIHKDFITINKGSICIDGISLTIVEAEAGAFSTAIIPHTMEHTNLRTRKEGDPVNLEFDMIGKYVARSKGQYGME